MGSSSVVVKVVCAVVILMGMIMKDAPIAEAGITCGQVSQSVAPCIGYLKNGGKVPPPCCNGVRSLNSAATTTPDRQAACRCLVQASKSISGINPNLAAGLPGACGVNIPYKISTSTNCNT